MADDFANFAQDLRDGLEQTDYFKGGQKSQRAHLDKMVASLNAIKRAADRVRADAGSMEETKLLFLCESGSGVLYNAKIARAKTTLE